MHKTVLVPIDFRVESLNTLKFALELHKEDRIQVVLLYSTLLDSSITELLFYSPSKTIGALITPEFREAMDILRNKFEHKIAGINIRLFHGYNQNAFSNFLEANNIDEIFIPKTYGLKLPERSFDPTPLIRKSSLPVYEMDWEGKVNPSEKDQLESLFNH